MTIVKNQYQQFIENNPAGFYFEQKIREDVAEKLSFYHPRSVRKVLNLAFGLAAIQQRNFLIVEDVRGSENKNRGGIGFMGSLNN